MVVINGEMISAVFSRTGGLQCLYLHARQYPYRKKFLPHNIGIHCVVIEMNYSDITAEVLDLIIVFKLSVLNGSVEGRKAAIYSSL